MVPECLKKETRSSAFDIISTYNRKEIKKFTFERHRIAQQIKDCRNEERGHNFPNNRGIDLYLFRLGGLEKFFNYVRGLESNIVIDIGAGLALAAGELSKDEMTQGILLLATGLYREKDVDKNLGFDKYRITPVETMRGIKDESVGGIIGLASIGYSSAPKTAINRLNEILVPGGIIKAKFCEGERGQESITHLKTHHDFSHRLLELGYDVSIRPGHSLGDILVAIKPGGKALGSAKSILESDFKEAYNNTALRKCA